MRYTKPEIVGGLIIIAIIAAILVPIFIKLGRPYDPQITCSVNFKQLGLAFLLYAQDYDEKMPGCVFRSKQSPTDSVNGTGWAGQLYPYFHHAELLTCPADDSTYRAPSSTQQSRISYAINSNIAVGPRLSESIWQAHTVLLFEISHVKATIVQPDEKRTSSAVQVSPAGNGVNGRLSSYIGVLPNVDEPARYATGILDNSTPSVPPSVDQYIQQTSRHKDGANFLFLDGHAKWHLPQNISAGGNALKSGNLQSQTGCAPDGSKHAGNYPCAASAEDSSLLSHAGTFSVN